MFQDDQDEFVVEKREDFNRITMIYRINRRES